MDATAASNSAAANPNDLLDVAPSPPDDLRITGAGNGAPPQPTDRHVCPYCGLVGPRPDGACPRCTIEDSPQTRQATKVRIGPWYVLQSRNPAAPGMKWSTLLALVKKGNVTPRSVVRGPTTHQLWRLASQVKGLSREFGVCYSCGARIERTTNQCPHCDRLQEPPALPDQLLEPRDTPRRTASESLPAEIPTAPAPNLPVRREVKPETGLLSAKDLATAFQLNFPDGAGADLTPRPVEPAADEAEASSPRRPVRVGRVVLVLLILGLIGAAAVVWMTPEYKARATALLDQGMTWARGLFAADPAEPEPSAPAGGLDDSETNPPADTQPPPQPPKSEPSAQTEARPADKPAADPARTVPTDPEGIRQRVRALRSAAIDAEAAGNYAAAVQQYEQIRRLPREFWPSDIEVRHTAARERAR